MAFPAFWHSAAVVYASQGLRALAAYLGRDTWPLVVSGDDVVAVPGIVEAPGWEDTVRAWKDPEG